MYTEEGVGKIENVIWIPKIRGDETEDYYYYRITDELLRFSVISDYILNKELFFPITDTYTRISDNEVILNSKLNTLQQYKFIQDYMTLHSKSSYPSQIYETIHPYNHSTTTATIK